MSTKLKDIAQYLNISVATVSRVVNGKDRVDEKTRSRVQEAIEKYNYSPNEVARNLKNKTTKAIGLIIPDITNNFFSEVIKGLESAVRKEKYSIILCNSDENQEREKEYLEFLFEKQITGVILATVSDKLDYISKFNAAKIPIVFIDNLPRNYSDMDCVTIDNLKASYELNTHLIKMGHGKIGIISGPLTETSGMDTYNGWKNALSDNGIDIKKEWIGYGDFKIESGYKIMKTFLKRKDFPAAFFSANNSMAYGAARAIMEAGLNIPGDIALVTFGAVDHTGLIRPKFTTIVEPAEDIGRIAGEIILRKIATPNVKTYEKIVLQHEILIGESCGYDASKGYKS